MHQVGQGELGILSVLGLDLVEHVPRRKDLLGSEFCQLLSAEPVVEWYLLEMEEEDLSRTLYVRPINFNLAIHATFPNHRWIKNVRSVGGQYHNRTGVFQSAH